MLRRTFAQWVQMVQQFMSGLERRKRERREREPERVRYAGEADSATGQEPEEEGYEEPWADDESDWNVEPVSRLNDSRQATGALRGKGKGRGGGGFARGRPPPGRPTAGPPRCGSCGGRHFVRTCPNVVAKGDPRFSPGDTERSGDKCLFVDREHGNLACEGRGHFARHHAQVVGESAAGPAPPRGAVVARQGPPAGAAARPPKGGGKGRSPGGAAKGSGKQRKGRGKGPVRARVRAVDEPSDEAEWLDESWGDEEYEEDVEPEPCDDEPAAEEPQHRLRDSGSWRHVTPEEFDSDTVFPMSFQRGPVRAARERTPVREPVRLEYFPEPLPVGSVGRGFNCVVTVRIGEARFVMTLDTGAARSLDPHAFFRAAPDGVGRRRMRSSGGSEGIASCSVKVLSKGWRRPR